MPTNSQGLELAASQLINPSHHSTAAIFFFCHDPFGTNLSVLVFQRQTAVDDSWPYLFFSLEQAGQVAKPTQQLPKGGLFGAKNW